MGLAWGRWIIIFFLGLCWLSGARCPSCRASPEAPYLCPPTGREQDLSVDGFCPLQGEGLQKDPVNFCALKLYGLAGAAVASRVPPCCHHQLPTRCFCRPGTSPRGAPSRCRQPRLPGSKAPCHPQLVRRATSQLTRFRWIMVCI